MLKGLCFLRRDTQLPVRDELSGGVQNRMRFASTQFSDLTDFHSPRASGTHHPLSSSQSWVLRGGPRGGGWGGTQVQRLPP